MAGVERLNISSITWTLKRAVVMTPSSISLWKLPQNGWLWSTWELFS